MKFNFNILKCLILSIVISFSLQSQAFTFKFNHLMRLKQVVYDEELCGTGYWTLVGGIGPSTANNCFFAVNYVPSQPTTYAIQSISGLSTGSTYELRTVTGQKCNGSVVVSVLDPQNNSLASISLGNPGNTGNVNSANSIQTTTFVANAYSAMVKINKTADPTSCQIEIDKVLITKQ